MPRTEAPKKKRARKATPRRRPLLTEPVLVRFTEEDYEAIATLAADADVPLAVWVRRAALNRLEAA